MYEKKIIKYKKSPFIETINILKDINENQMENYSSRVKSANIYDLKNNIGYVGLKLKIYSGVLKSQKIDKPEKLLIAGS
ncbi:MAG: hypothetical protein HeimC2_28000 [Candidatus Heimdallarchaeota archaeon LC_2]|nr:MAG: hypothetical protein HeimC2_28000 [Candidatus Heimdallarchaeota archaeon LC_2]